jgi:simple sugar transport system ATP-binding protein
LVDHFQGATPRDRHHVAELTGSDITTDNMVRAIAAPERETIS